MRSGHLRLRHHRHTAAVAVVLVALAGCSSSKHTTTATSVPTSSTTAAGATTTTIPTGTAGGTTTTAPLSPPLPAPATTGTLHVSATISLPLSFGPVQAAEAPDGAVFVAPAGGSPVYVVDGDQPAVVAETVDDVEALAADDNNVYIGKYTLTATTVISYDRTTGSEIRQWTLPGINSANASNNRLLFMAAAGGALWVTITVVANLSDGGTAPTGYDVYRIDPGSAASPAMVASSKETAIGPDGSVYYESSDAHLVRRSPSGQLTVGPALANSPNSEGGGVQYVDTVAAGVVWVDEPAGQGLDAGYFTFNTVTLAPVGGPFGGNTGEAGITDTLAGSLDLDQGNAVTTCPMEGTVAVECLFRISTTATLSDPAIVGTGFALLGPYPAVIASNAANTAVQLERFS